MQGVCAFDIPIGSIITLSEVITSRRDYFSIETWREVGTDTGETLVSTIPLAYTFHWNQTILTESILLR